MQHYETSLLCILNQRNLYHFPVWTFIIMNYETSLLWNLNITYTCKNENTFFIHPLHSTNPSCTRPWPWFPLTKFPTFFCHFFNVGTCAPLGSHQKRWIARGSACTILLWKHLWDNLHQLSTQHFVNFCLKLFWILLFRIVAI